MAPKTAVAVRLRAVGAAAASLVTAAALCASCGFASAERSFDRDEPGSIDFGATTRTWTLHVPPDADAAGALPLVVSLHGAGGTGVDSDNVSDLDHIADSEGFYVAKPDGVDHGWNDGRTDGSQSPARLATDDVGFLVALVDAVSSRYPVDRSRVYAVGFSNGAMMGLRLVCDRADVFAGAVAVAGSLPATGGPCLPTRGVRVALIDGTQDPIVPFGGGEAGSTGEHGLVIGAPATAELFATALDCTLGGSSSLTDAVTETLWSCPATAAVALVTVSGGGHTWPAGPQNLPEDVVGPVDPWPASPWIWSFLSGTAPTE